MVFVQLSKIQRHWHARQDRIARNQHKHDAQFPNLHLVREEQARELAELVRAQAADKLRNAEVQVHHREMADAP